MFSGIVGLIAATAPVIALLLWRDYIDRQEHAALLVRADVYSGATRALDGDTVLAVAVRASTTWRRGEVHLSTPRGYESLIGHAAYAVFERTPAGYDIVIHCGMAS